MKQSGVLPDIDGHYEQPSCQTSSSPLLLTPSKWAGWAIIFNWCCFSTSNGMTVEYLFRNLIPQGINTFWSLIFQLKKKNAHIWSSMHTSLYFNFQSEKRKLFWNECHGKTQGNAPILHSYMIWEKLWSSGEFLFYVSEAANTTLARRQKRKIIFKNTL